jgi:hypothetical protein
MIRSRAMMSTRPATSTNWAKRKKSRKPGRPRAAEKSPPPGNRKRNCRWPGRRNAKKPSSVRGWTGCRARRPGPRAMSWAWPGAGTVADERSGRRPGPAAPPGRKETAADRRSGSSQANCSTGCAGKRITTLNSADSNSRVNTPGTSTRESRLLQRKLAGAIDWENHSEGALHGTDDQPTGPQKTQQAQPADRSLGFQDADATKKILVQLLVELAQKREQFRGQLRIIDQRQCSGWRRSTRISGAMDSRK